MMLDGESEICYSSPWMWCLDMYKLQLGAIG